MSWCFAAIALQGSPAKSPSAAFLIERHRAGSVMIGGSADRLYEKFASEQIALVDLRLEGTLSPALQIRPSGTTRKDALVAELTCRDHLIVSRINVYDTAFRTAANVRVGSSVGELRRAYKVGAVITGEGNVGVRVDELEATFVIADPQGRIDPRAIPDSARIKSILLN